MSAVSTAAHLAAAAGLIAATVAAIAWADRLDAFADTTASVHHRELYAAVAADLRDCLSPSATGEQP